MECFCSARGVWLMLCRSVRSLHKCAKSKGCTVSSISSFSSTQIETGGLVQIMVCTRTYSKSTAKHM